MGDLVPDQRYQTATEPADAVHDALTEGPPIHAPDTASQRWGARGRRLEEYRRGG